MRVRLPGSDEDQLVGTGSISKTNGTPQTVSNAEFASVYKNGLGAAKPPESIVQLSEVIKSDRRPADHPLHTQWSRPLDGSLHYTPGALSIEVAQRWDAG